MQDISELGIRLPVAEVQQQPQREIFQVCRENKGWKNVCLLPALPTATYIRARAETGCPAQTQDQELCSLGWWQKQCGNHRAVACDAVQEGKPSVVWRLVLSQWCDGFLGCFQACGVWHNLGGKALWERYSWRMVPRFPSLKIKQCTKLCELTGRVKSSAISWPSRSILTLKLHK